MGNQPNWNTKTIMSRNAHTNTGMELVMVQNVVINTFRKPFLCQTIRLPRVMPSKKVMLRLNTEINSVQGMAYATRSFTVLDW